MKKILVFLLLVISIKTVHAHEYFYDFTEIPARYYYTYNHTMPRGEEFKKFVNVETNEKFFPLFFGPVTDRSFWIEMGDINYKSYDIEGYLCEDDIREIERIIFWGSYLDNGTDYYIMFATQLKILSYLYPEVQFYASDKIVNKLDYLDPYINNLNNLLNGNIPELDNLILPLDVEISININLDSFTLIPSENLIVNYDNRILSLKALSDEVYLEIKKDYDYSIKSTYLKNYTDQIFMSSPDNIYYYNKINFNVVNDLTVGKENPPTGDTLFYKVVFIAPLIFMSFIPIVILILIKNKESKK